MAVSAIMGALSAGTAFLTGGTLMGGFLIGAGALGGTVLTHFLVSTAMGAALNALAPKPNIGSSSGYTLKGASGSALDHQIIYGKCKAGGVRVYDATTGDTNKYLHRILAFAGHEVNSYEEIYVDNELVTLDGTGNVTSPAKWDGYVRIKRYYGTETQSADPDLINDTNTLSDNAGKWTSAHTLSGIAYLYIRLRSNTDKFPNGVPVINAVIKGKKVYDPRTALTAWSDNTALCLRDYLTSGYGFDQPDSKVNDTATIAAANICDQITQSEKRYTCSGTFLTSLAPRQIISDIISSMGGLFWYSSGVWNMKAAAYVAPVLSFNEDDLRSGISVSTRHSRRDNFNTVKGVFSGEESDWQVADYPEVSSAEFVDADNGIANIVDNPLPFTKTTKTCQRLSRVFLNRNREQLSISATFGIKALQVDIGDNINFSNTRFGWVNKPFEVTSWSLALTDNSDVVVNMVMREISSGVFTEADPSTFENNNTTLPNPYDQVAIGLTLSTEFRVAKESVVTVLGVNVSSGTPDLVEQVQVQYKLSSDTDWKNVGYADLGVTEIVGLEDGTYDVRARSFSYFGVKSDWELVQNYVLSSVSDIPEDITNFYVDISGNSATLNWDESLSQSLSHYKIRHSSLTSGATWENAVTYVAKVARPATSWSGPGKPGTYMIKAFDKFGQSSENFTSVVILTQDLLAYLNQTTTVQHPTFSGTKTNTSVVSSNLVITAVSGSPTFIGTYDFDTYVDLGAIEKFRTYVDFTVVRQDTASATFDTLTGSFDSLNGLFDGLTGGVGANDIDVKTYVSTTQTNPAGSPVWTPYSLLKMGVMTARAVRYRVELSSDSVGITPQISSMTGIIDYN